MSRRCILLGGWLAVISLVSIAVTVWDKRAARRHRRRVPERTLLWLGAAGGGAAMLLAMWVIRHKTRHAKFMLGLPAMVAVQAAVLWWLLSDRLI